MAFNAAETFLAEAEELLAEIEEAALALEDGAANEDGAALEDGSAQTETIHKLFRAFHTIKGSGAMSGFDEVAAFTHQIETLLGKVRDGLAPVSPELTGTVLSAKDRIRSMLFGESGAEAASEPGPEVEGHLEATPGEAAGERLWTIEFRPNPDLLARGDNPVFLFADLARLGPLAIEGHADVLPPVDEMQADVCYLRWTLRLRSEAGINAIRDVFLFVEDGAEIGIRSEAADAGPKRAAEPGPAAGRLAPEKAAEKTEKAGERAAAEKRPHESMVRVPAGRLDRLVALVGELVMNQSRLAQASSQIESAELSAPVEEIERLVSELRDNVLGIRMMPIGTILGRFRRLVHDLSGELGKEMELVTEGAETELDKSVLDQLGEPLVHLLRNSIDHGIEPAGERERAGKPRRGTIRLQAAHTGSEVVVEVSDDGRGLDCAAIRAKAVEKGLIGPETVLSEKETFHLILLPGFSTARQVTSISGRGVGMDVVKRQIEALRGSLSIASVAGQGTTLSLRLPLTLAIIDGLTVQIGGDQFIIPMAAVLENMELRRADRARRNGRNVATIRGGLIPYIDLRAVFGMGGEEPALEKIVIVRHEDQRVGLLVDRVLGTHQTVIQSLGRFFRRTDVVSGATIMGDGRVALILDTAAVVRRAGQTV